MLVHYQFAPVVLKYGTVATVTDPHELANVLGANGIDYMMKNAKHARHKFHFGAASCVPVASFETSGASIDSNEISIYKLRDN
jgi:adenine deaminase